MSLKPVNPKRNYGIDALRILSMLMIAVHHVISHGGLMKSRDMFSVGYDALVFLELVVLCAVNCYVLISGYVGLYSRHKYSSIASLWLQVFFYSAGVTVLFKIFKPDSVDGATLFRSFIPALGREYWFFTSYFILFLVMPMLNNAVNNLSRRRLEVMLLTLIVFIGVFSSIYDAYFNSDVFLVNRGYAPWWMMVIYMVGGYIRKYDVFGKVKKSRFLIVFFATVVVALALKLLVQSYVLNKYGTLKYNTLFYKYTSLNICICAVSLFLFFRNLDLRSWCCRAVAFLAPMTFSVYLIHDHPLIRKYVIQAKLGFISRLSTPLMLLTAVGVAVGIYLVCSLIDLLRLYLFKWLKVKPRLAKLEDRIKERISRPKNTSS